MRYSPELKESVLKRILPPGSEPTSKVAREEGIPEHTTRNRRNKARVEGTLSPSGSNADERSTRDKFLVVVETACMNESELAEYARKKGLYTEQIKTWQDACVNADGAYDIIVGDYYSLFHGPVIYRLRSNRSLRN